ncbi:hypothetical protein [Burkholderia gladioli]|uniref:hypothetical protein n=1 Tax=Burkholderia gladioli TaxID=28095 RepID=UPI0005C5347A|nr:hypothetical protein [Burkholderia gladioli]
MSLFDNSAELHAMLSRLEFGGKDVGRVLRERLVRQRHELPALGRFACLLDKARYEKAFELIDSVATRLVSAEHLEVHLLALEHDFVKLQLRANRARSSKRFDPFWDEFDESIRRRVCVTAKDAFDYAVERTGAPYPKWSTAKERFRTVKNSL